MQESGGLVGAVVGEFEKGLECQAKIRQKIVHTMGANEGSKQHRDQRGLAVRTVLAGSEEGPGAGNQVVLVVPRPRGEDANLGSRLLPVLQRGGHLQPVLMN